MIKMPNVIPEKIRVMRIQMGAIYSIPSDHLNGTQIQNILFQILECIELLDERQQAIRDTFK